MTDNTGRPENPDPEDFQEDFEEGFQAGFQDELEEAMGDSPVELTEAGLTLRLGGDEDSGPEGEEEQVEEEPVTAEDLAELAAVEAELKSRPSETEPNPSLDRIRMLMDLLGNPERSFAVIHVAGTNGKSSTARITDSLLRAFHRRVGLFVTPALSSMSECVLVDGRELSPRRFIDTWEEIRPYVGMVDDHFAGQGEPGMSTFEVLVAIAFAAFADAPIDVAVIEAGMGGTWDATNIVDSEVAVVTPVAMDHSDWLGETIAEIAEHKAGIIKSPADNDDPARPGETITVLAHQEHDALIPLLNRTVEVGSAVARAGAEFGVAKSTVAIGGQTVDIRGLGGEYPQLFLPLSGEHQAQNAAVALAAVEAFFGASAGRSLDQNTVEEGMAQVIVPGRMERLRADPTVLVDTAHNPHGIATLAATVERDFNFNSLVGVFSALEDKDVAQMLEVLEPVVDHLVVYQNRSPRALAAEELAELAYNIFGDERVLVADGIVDAYDRALTLSDEEGEGAYAGKGIIITGSVVTAGEARSLLRPRG